ncbi:hypothetical protein B0H10DRAFT_748185 [Mycena sp. CBHHK59/15]|nr:hypothetical protein B0H10DRAFT_748185 [Mycena sp. CBHHK59/15]
MRAILVLALAVAAVSALPVNDVSDVVVRAPNVQAAVVEVSALPPFARSPAVFAYGVVPARPPGYSSVEARCPTQDAPPWKRVAPTQDAPPWKRVAPTQDTPPWKRAAPTQDTPPWKRAHPTEDTPPWKRATPTQATPPWKRD